MSNYNKNFSRSTAFWGCEVANGRIRVYALPNGGVSGVMNHILHALNTSGTHNRGELLAYFRKHVSEGFQHSDLVHPLRRLVRSKYVSIRGGFRITKLGTRYLSKVASQITKIR